MRKSRFSEEQIIRIVEEVQGGRLVKDVCREQGISEGTYHRWKAKYGGLDVSEARRLRELEQENRRLKAAVADLTLREQALKDALSRNGDAHGPACGGDLVPGSLRAQRERSLRVGRLGPLDLPLPPSGRSWRVDLRRRIEELAAERSRFGYRRLHALLVREGRQVNAKRVYRLYREMGLAVRRKRRKQVAHANRQRGRCRPSRTCNGRSIS